MNAILYSSHESSYKMFHCMNPFCMQLFRTLLLCSFRGFPSCRSLTATHSLWQTEPIKKKKWNKDSVQVLAAWKQETQLLFGAPVKAKKPASKTVSDKPSHVKSSKSSPASISGVNEAKSDKRKTASRALKLDVVKTVATKKSQASTQENEKGAIDSVHSAETTVGTDIDLFCSVVGNKVVHVETHQPPIEFPDISLSNATSSDDISQQALDLLNAESEAVVNVVANEHASKNERTLINSDIKPVHSVEVTSESPVVANNVHQSSQNGISDHTLEHSKTSSPKTTLNDPDVGGQTVINTTPAKRGRKKTKIDSCGDSETLEKDVSGSVDVKARKAGTSVKRSKSADKKIEAKKQSEDASTPPFVEERCHYEWVDEPPIKPPKVRCSTETNDANKSSQQPDIAGDLSPQQNTVAAKTKIDLSESVSVDTNGLSVSNVDKNYDPKLSSSHSSQPVRGDIDAVNLKSVRGISLTSVSTNPSSENSTKKSCYTDIDPAVVAANSFILTFPLFANSSSLSLPADPSLRFPSVSSVLKTTMSEESRLTLERWEKQMIAELGDEGFRLYKNTLFANGTNLHTNIQHYLSGKPDEEIKILPANEGHWRSMEPVLSCISEVICLEQPVRHGTLQYSGVLDCVADYRGHRHIIEWKTSKRRKASIRYTFDNPLQLVAYLGAFNCQPSTQLQVERCMLVIGYDDGTPADVHIMDKWDCLTYWSAWLQRLHAYRITTQSIVKSPSCSMNSEVTGLAVSLR